MSTRKWYMSVSERLARDCKVRAGEVASDTDLCTVSFYVGDLRKLLAVLDAARACNGHIITYGEQHLTDELREAVQECDE